MQESEKGEYSAETGPWSLRTCRLFLEGHDLRSPRFLKKPHLSILEARKECILDGE